MRNKHPQDFDSWKRVFRNTEIRNNTNTVPAKEASPRFRQLEISVQRHKSLRPFEATNGH